MNQFLIHIAASNATAAADSKKDIPANFNHCCNCTSECYHPWGNHAPAHNTSAIRAAATIRRQDNSYYSPSLLPPPLKNMDVYAAMFFGVHMSCIDFRDPITGMIAMSSRVKHSKLSVYERDPISIQECERSVNWKTAKQGNSWYESIMTEINNLIKYDVFTVVSRQLGIFSRHFSISSRNERKSQQPRKK
jgi:hypothetical protein